MPFPHFHDYRFEEDYARLKSHKEQLDKLMGKQTLLQRAGPKIKIDKL